MDELLMKESHRLIQENVCGFWVVGLRLSHKFKGNVWQLRMTSTELYCDVRGEFRSTRKLFTQRNENTEFEGTAVSVLRIVKSVGSRHSVL